MKTKINEIFINCDSKFGVQHLFTLESMKNKYFENHWNIKDDLLMTDQDIYEDILKHDVHPILIHIENLFKYLDLPYDEETIDNAIIHNFLTIHNVKGRFVAWYHDTCEIEAACYLDTGERLS